LHIEPVGGQVREEGMNITAPRTMTYAFAAAALATIVAGCGGSSSGGDQSVAPASGGSSTSSSHTSDLTTHSTSIGTVVADANGRTVYELVGNPASNSKCYGSCMSIWPAVMSGGQIAVVHGHPVFTFSGDTSAGQTHGQKVNDTWGLWLALDPKGKPISGSAGSAPAPSRSSAPASSSSSSSGGGGYGY
jgi:predicted lipoprotein with Yx(FWY)xxD motif